MQCVHSFPLFRLLVKSKTWATSRWTVLSLIWVTSISLRSWASSTPTPVQFKAASRSTSMECPVEIGWERAFYGMKMKTSRSYTKTSTRTNSSSSFSNTSSSVELWISLSRASRSIWKQQKTCIRIWSAWQRTKQRMRCARCLRSSKSRTCRRAMVRLSQTIHHTHRTSPTSL